MLKRRLDFLNREISLDADRPREPDLPRLPVASAGAKAKSGPRHTALTIAIHWTTVAAIVIAVAAMFVHDATEDRGWRQFLVDMHRQLGLLVLLGAGVRIAFRLRHGLADHAP